MKDWWREEKYIRELMIRMQLLNETKESSNNQQLENCEIHQIIYRVTYNFDNSKDLWAPRELPCCKWDPQDKLASIWSHPLHGLTSHQCLSHNWIIKPKSNFIDAFSYILFPKKITQLAAFPNHMQLYILSN